LSDLVQPTFTPIASCAGRTGVWRPIGFVMSVFELWFDDLLVARLRSTRAMMRMGSELTTADGTWEFARRSFWSTGFEVRRQGQDVALAEYEPNTWLGLVYMGSGTIQFDSGARFSLRRTDFWAGRYTILNDNDAPVLTVQPSWLALRRGVKIVLDESSARVPETPVLAGIALHVLLGRRRAHAH